MALVQSSVFFLAMLCMVANYFSDVDAATFIVSQGHLPEVQTPVTFTTYAPLATFGGTPSAKGNVTLEVMQPSAASGCELQALVDVLQGVDSYSNTKQGEY